MIFNVKKRWRRLTGLITTSCSLLGLTCLANPPSGFSATPGTNQVKLNWNAEASVTNYVIRRSLDLNGTYTTIVNTGTVMKWRRRSIFTFEHAVTETFNHLSS